MKKTSRVRTKLLSFSKFRYLFASALVLTLTSNAWACFTPALEHTVPWQELVQRTGTIVVAEVLSAKPVVRATTTINEGNTLYNVKVLETLKGSDKTKLNTGIDLLGNPPPRKADNDFTAHQETTFWKDNAGRTIVAPDCSLRPSLVVGAKYLLFVDKPYHVKSFENISNPEDRWLEKVRAEIKLSATAPSPKPK